MKRKILLILLSLIVTVCMGLFFSSCTQDARYSKLKMENGIVYLSDYSVKYTSEEESPLGEVNESALSEEKSGSVQTYYLVMDFNMQTAEDIQGMEWLTVTLTILDADIVKATINYTNTSTTQEITENGETTITAAYSLPDEARLIKNVTLVVELKAQNIGATDIICSFSCDSKSVTGYEEKDSTYSYSTSTVALSKTSFEYTLNEDGQSYSIAGIGTKSDIELRAIHIPDTYNGLPVTTISSATFQDCTFLTKIAIPDSITSIGNSAFGNCSSLISVYITDITAWYNISFGNFYSNPLYYAGNLYLN